MTMPANPGNPSAMSCQDIPASLTEAAETGKLASQVPPHLSEGVAVLAVDNAVVCWTLQAERITGYSLQEVKAVSFTQLFEPAIVIQQLVDQAHAGIPTEGKRVQLRRADGKQVGVDVRCSPLHHLDETRRDVVIILRDLSDYETRQHCPQDHERLHTLSQLAGAVSHEIHNPLTTILLHTDMLDEDLRQLQGEDHEQLLRSLAVIKEEVSRMHDLAEQYLLLARLSALPYEPEDLGAFLEAFGLEIQPRLAARGITMRLEGTTELGQVALHKRAFRRALLDVFNQVLEGMPLGGTISLHAQRTATDVRVRIRTTGTGIPPERLSRLFSPTPNIQPNGMGLGLYGAREIIAAHGGSIEVANEPGTSTTFTIALPSLTLEAQPARNAE
jgi:two-component system, NtrC family, sensor histidine kinase HydH